MLVALTGLPGAGKSAVADAVGRVLRAPVFSIDPLETALWQAGVDRAQPTGLAAYAVAHAAAHHTLSLGLDAVVDAVNAAEPAREAWRALAARHGVPLRVLHVVCSDESLHRARLESRRRDLPGFTEPTWADVTALRAEYAPWPGALVLDSVDGLDALLARALDYLATATVAVPGSTSV
ncbi:AAA family ATPase [Actinosynnema sp. NPDC020468]|uniref:AAA family ATPase n=1 Tax=Actinosynnema sp. NPDC020468 TaxID=3154488 RepID=UPI0033D90A4E